MNSKNIILDLCGGTGSWSYPYRKAGYQVIIVDPINSSLSPWHYVEDLRKFVEGTPFPVHGILAAPPCTEFASSGARWWKRKDPALLDNAFRVVKDCLLIVRILKPKWWCLENPVGRLPRFIGPYKETFQPCDYGDPYTKRTCLWGNFTMPPRTPVLPTQGSKLWKLGPSPDRARLRSITPPGFAEAFFKANP